MKSAEIYSVPLTIGGSFGWRWRSDDGRASPHWFVFYRDCAFDARRNGYAVIERGPARSLPVTRGHIAPGLRPK